MEYVFTPWKNRLLADLRRAERHVLLISPFIKSAIAADIYHTLADLDVTVHTISRFTPGEFVCGASDLEAHYILSGLGATDARARYHLRRLDVLHAKIFIIDWQVAYIGSSNLTFSGLLRNYEGTVRLAGEQQIKPLRERFEALWRDLDVVGAADFAAMAASLAEAAAAHHERQPEHLYDTALTARSEGQGMGVVLESALQQDAALDGGEAHPVPSIDVLALADTAADATDGDTGRADEADGPASTSVEADASLRGTLVRSDALRTHAVTVRRFLRTLRNRLDLDVPDAKAWRYALALRTPSVQGMWSADLVAREAYAPVDPQRLYEDQQSWLDTLGDTVYDACVVQVAVKSGIVASYGVAMAHQFRARARAADLMSRLWHQNFLGRLLFGPGEKNLRDQQLQRLHAWAIKRLMAIVYLEHGLPRVHALVEEFFNPADLLGTDIVSMAGHEPAKTTLQVISQQQLQGLPEYHEPVMSGPEHDLTFEATVTLALGLSAQGRGRSHQEASRAAATAALARAAHHPYWSKALARRRRELVEQAQARHVPLFPDASLSQQDQRRTSAAYARRFGVAIEPSLGYAACIDPVARSRMKLGYSHDTMAWYGSALLEVLRHEARQESSHAGTARFWRDLGELMDVPALRSELGIANGWEGSPGQWSGTIQAIACAVYFSNDYDTFRAWLLPLVAQVEARAAALAVDVSAGDQLASLATNFDGARAYPAILQEALQARALPLPVYSAGRIVAQTREGNFTEVSATWGGLAVQAREGSKVLARNAVAFLLLKALVEQGPLA